MGDLFEEVSGEPHAPPMSAGVMCAGGLPRETVGGGGLDWVDWEEESGVDQGSLVAADAAQGSKRAEV